MKKIVAVVCVLLMLCALPVQAQPVLTMDRAVMVNDTQIILEFSEPVAINLLGASSGPFAAVRLVNNKNMIQTSRDEQAQNLQWLGTLEYVDEKKDRLIFTVGFSRLGVDTVSDVYNRAGALADYRDLYCCMCLEEVAFDSSVSAYNGLIENVTSLDGKRLLCANTVSWDGIYVRLEKDYEYDYDPGAALSITDRTVSADMVLGTVEQEPVLPVRNDSAVVAVILGAGVLLAVLLSVIVVAVVRRKEKKA